MEVYSDDDNSIEHEIDINPPRSWTNIDGFVFYVAFGDDATSNEIYVNVTVHDGLDWKDVYDEQIVCSASPCSGHVWMHWMSYDRQVNVSRLRFRCSDYINERLVLGSVGIHFLKKYEKRPSSIWELENDDENPNQDLELENADENPKEVFGKRRRDDEYDYNMKPNWYPKQKRQHSSTMGITITELENDDENPKSSKGRFGFRA